MENKPLTEKYRPTTLSEVIGQQHNINVLKGWVEQFKAGKTNFPNMLFYGPPGTGKTSAAKAFAREILGDSYPMGLMELNASEERTLGTVRGKIKDFAQSSPFGKINLLIYDEADHTARDTQPALRRIMEQYNSTTRFILIANDLEGIINPLRSRCAPFNFGSVDDEELVPYARKICTAEEIPIEDALIPKVVELADGKPRNVLQILSILSTQTIVTKEVIDKLIKNQTKAIWESLFRGIFSNPLSADVKVIELLDKEGIRPRTILEQLMEQLIKNEDPTINKIAAHLFVKIAEYDFRIAFQGTSPRLQIRSLVWAFYHAHKGVKV